MLNNFKDAQTQIEKFETLREIIENNQDLQFANFKKCMNSVLDDVFEFFNNRTKWKKLYELIDYLNFQAQNSNINVNNNESRDLKVIKYSYFFIFLY